MQVPPGGAFEWSSGGVSTLRLGGCGFEPLPGPTKDCASLFGTQYSGLGCVCRGGLDQPVIPGCGSAATTAAGTGDRPLMISGTCSSGTAAG